MSSKHGLDWVFWAKTTMRVWGDKRRDKKMIEEDTEENLKRDQDGLAALKSLACLVENDIRERTGQTDSPTKFFVYTIVVAIVITGVLAFLKLY